MAKITTPEHIKSIHGKVDGTGDNYYSERYGETYLVHAPYTPRTPSPAQLNVQAKFTAVSALVSAEMQDPVSKAKWQEKADLSDGKYKTARGAAFSTLYATYESAGE